MKPDDKEAVLSEQKLHWGIFIPPALLCLLSLIPLASIYFVIQLLTRSFGTISGEPRSFSLWWVWLVILIPEALIFLATLGSYLTSRVTLTSQRLVFKTGFLFRLSGELPLDRVESTLLFQPLFGRMFGYGTVVVNGTGGTPFRLAYLRNPENFQQLLKQAVTDAQARRRQPVAVASELPPRGDSRFMPKPK